MKWSGVPEVATPRVMSQALGTLFVSGAGASLLAVLGSAGTWSAKLPLATLGSWALVTGGVVLRWGPRWPRPVFHAAVLLATALVVSGVVVSTDAPTALTIGTLASFLAVAACFFFSLPFAVGHTVLALLGVSTGLLVQGDVTLLTALSLAAMIGGLSVVTRRLVLRASSASRDPLTGLTNRRGFDQALQDVIRAVSRAGVPMSAALLDLDHFKTINDTEGHDAGDRVLRTVAKVWRSALPTTAVLARHGGDEFALLLPGLGGPAALELVQQIRAQHPDIGMSCGVAEHEPGESGAQLMRRADLALYTAKAGGRGRCELGAGPTASDLATELTAALDAGEVTVAFQPVIDIAAGRLVGVEALARWTHPVLGVVSPTQFIAVAEQHGLMPRLGELVFRSACSQLAELHAATGRRLRLGVNVSGRELSDPTYPDRVGTLLAETGWRARDVLLEVTESLVEAESSTAVAALHRLRALGLGVAIDDFGTGYSSLSRLDTLPSAVLKLDSSFVATIATSERRATMLRSIVGMAQVLGMDVVAEGVETVEQDAQLRAIGCRFGQGWLYGEPSPLAAIAALMDPPVGRVPALYG